MLCSAMTHLRPECVCVCACVCVCSNGVGRTGVFISLHILLERVIAEGLVDVFQTVKNLRIQRPAIVQTLVREGGGCG